MFTLLLAACGGAQPATTAKSPSGGASREVVRGPDGLPIDDAAMNPRVERWRTVHRYVLRPSERCVSGAMDLFLPPTEVRWARALRFRMRAPRDLSFHFEIRRKPRVAEWVGATMWGFEAKDHETIQREQSACVSESAAPPAPAASSTSTKAPPAPNKPAVTSHGAPGNHQRGTTVTPPRPVELEVPVSAESPLGGFVDLGDVPFNMLADKHFFNKQWVIEPRLAEVPMNDDNRGWVLEDANNAPLYVRIWTQEPQDFDGVVLEIVDEVLEPSIPEAEYARLMERRLGAGKERQEAFMTLCREHPEDEKCYFTKENQQKLVGTSRPPPPPREEKQPPRPSADHVWIGGGWQWNGSDYVWIAGMWRYVPPAVVATAAGSTQTTTLALPSTVEERRPPIPAPSASSATPKAPPARSDTTSTTSTTSVSLTQPTSAVAMPSAAPQAPAVRVETIPPAPRAGAMWIAGYWSWTGTAWVWVSGRWQLPPDTRMRWAPPAVQAGPGGVRVFMPGGWLRLGS